MKLIFGRDEEVAKWAAMELGMARMGMLRLPFVKPYTAIGVEVDGQIGGALIFNAYTGPDIELTVAGKHVWTRAIFRWVAAYVFTSLRCGRISITLRASRLSYVDLAERVGFSREGYSPMKFGDDDGILMGMVKADCSWLTKDK